MFDRMAYQSQSSSLYNNPDCVAPVTSQLFDRVLGAGRRKRMMASLLGNSRRLYRLADVEAESHVRARHHAGVQVVAIKQIRGSVGKAEDFDIDFNPIYETSRARWMRVATAMSRDAVLPPVELIQMDDIYFVVDGHHRISVARALHQTHIDAIVIKWEVSEF